MDPYREDFVSLHPPKMQAAVLYRTAAFFFRSYPVVQLPHNVLRSYPPATHVWPTGGAPPQCSLHLGFSSLQMML
jgi:hypothetical protein